MRDRLSIARHLPHATKLFLLKKAPDRPDLLASTFHLTGGAVEVRTLQFDGKRLTLEMEKAGRQYGKLFFLVPEPYEVVSVRFNGRRRGWQKVVKGVIWIGFHLLGEAKLLLSPQSLGPVLVALGPLAQGQRVQDKCLRTKGLSK